jgi:hypothetical protein
MKSKFEKIKEIVNSIDDNDSIKENLISELTVLKDQESDAKLKHQINATLDFLHRNDTNILVDTTRDIINPNINTIFFCVPMKTWAYKSMDMTYNLLFCKKNHIFNNFIEALELNAEELVENIKTSVGIQELYLHTNMPRLIAVKALDLGGELVKAPQHFALFLPEFYIDKFNLKDNLVTLYFPEIYLKRHLDFIEKSDLNLYDQKDDINVLFYLTVWFKGHELGHYLRSSPSHNFWDDVKKQYSTFEAGVLEELLADLFGLQFGFEYPVVAKNLHDFICVYMNELFLYSNRIAENKDLYFEDSSSANIQINFLYKYLNKPHKNSEDGILNMNPDEFKDAFTTLFINLFNALTTIELEESKAYITSLLEDITLQETQPQIVLHNYQLHH